MRRLGLVTLVTVALLSAAVFAGPVAGARVPRKAISLRATVIAATLTGFFAAENTGKPHFVYANRMPAIGALVSVRAVWDGHNRFWVYGSTGTSTIRTIGTRHAVTVIGSVGTLDRSNHRFTLMLQGEQVTPVSYRTLQTPALLKAASRRSSTHVIRLSLSGQRWRLVSIR